MKSYLVLGDAPLSSRDRMTASARLAVAYSESFCTVVVERHMSEEIPLLLIQRSVRKDGFH